MNNGTDCTTIMKYTEDNLLDIQNEHLLHRTVSYKVSETLTNTLVTTPLMFSYRYNNDSDIIDYLFTTKTATHSRGVATGVYGYLYLPKISPSKLFMG